MEDILRSAERIDPNGKCRIDQKAQNGKKK